jgi:hypothetical protein
MSHDDPERVRQLLLTARDENQLVQVRRGIARSDRLDGYVLGVGDEWTSFASFDWNLMGVNGFVAVRTSDVDEVQSRDTVRLARRTLELHGEWPPAQPPAPLRLDNTRSLIESIVGQSPLVHIRHERNDPDAYIGAVLRTTSRSVELRLIWKEATWAEVDRWLLEDITWIEFGGRYEAALYELAGAPASASRLTRSIPDAPTTRGACHTRSTGTWQVSSVGRSRNARAQLSSLGRGRKSR